MLNKEFKTIEVFSKIVSSIKSRAQDIQNHPELGSEEKTIIKEVLQSLEVLERDFNDFSEVWEKLMIIFDSFPEVGNPALENVS